jgi:hypothetical protein
MGWLRRVRPARSSNKVALDQATLAQLAKAGGDLTKSTDVRNFLLLRSDDDARKATTQLESLGYSVHMQPVQNRKFKALLVANSDMVPSAENVAALRARFETLASEYDGTYDGWEAAVTR